MIARTGGILLEWAAARRRRAWERLSRRAAAVQEQTLLRLVRTARATEFGRQHSFDSVRSVTDYQARVPLADYLAFAPRWARSINGEADVTWPGRACYWVKTSGTTAGDKCIPVTREALASHRQGGWDALYLAVEKAGGGHLLGGRLLFLGGSSVLKPLGHRCQLGDLSGLMVRRLPRIVRNRYSPGRELAGVADWAARLPAMARHLIGQDLRLISGMPSWMVVFFESVAAARRTADLPAEPLGRCWPNLRVFIHGGMAYPPYGRVIDEWIGRPLERIEVYPASEGFVAVQTEAWGLTLMLDYGIFYEFVPVEDLDRAHPRRHTVADLELNRPYAVVLTSPAGLWSYLLGDTVRFVARDPLRLQIIGRTRHFVNAFGENVIVEEVEESLLAACRATGASVAEFTVGPRYACQGAPQGAHHWVIEFRDAPPDLAQFARALDARLQALNTDYRTKRAGNVGMVGPQVTPVPAATFYRWMDSQGKLGDQHKVPRATNSRDVIEGILGMLSNGAGAAANPPPDRASPHC
jgi:hypothetical protein